MNNQFSIQRFLQAFWRDERGVLVFEWVVIVALLTIGIIGGLAAMRDITVYQFGNIVQAAGNLDHSCGFVQDANGKACPYFSGGTFSDTRASASSVVTVTPGTAPVDASE